MTGPARIFVPATLCAVMASVFAVSHSACAQRRTGGFADGGVYVRGYDWGGTLNTRRVGAEATLDPQDHNDSNLHLFLDDEEIQHKEYLLHAINKLKKHPRPILAADRPWEGDRAQA